MTQSQSIPIANSNRGPTDEEAEQYHHAMLADYKDYCFYSRLVEGMRRKQGKTKDVALRYENQALIDHIVRTRNTQAQHHSTLSQSPTSVRNFGDDSARHSASKGTRRVRSRADMVACIDSAVEISRGEDSEWGDDDPFIFDMEL
eukprot:CAMPEP_0176191918 /NCGR_PEP_ID=MMETSP0121_2-20121125/4704_1 /TAXON_ID=160619 /ORGANISM="Kryptoperidinium foliaceum, Strain CCMP 1326" /LENGTH=144 /DNA_ID=CAMNT_0017530591 /DNA_START=110 /DNA_END=544 /DNA_ORIENTATION=-